MNTSSLCLYADITSTKKDDLQIFCALNIMMDEAIANLTCTLDEYGLSDNTILIISGDNGVAYELA